MASTGQTVPLDFQGPTPTTANTTTEQPPTTSSTSSTSIPNDFQGPTLTPTASTTTAEKTTQPNPPNHQVLLINGPNLNLLGTREPQLYGSTTLAQVEESITQRGTKLGISIKTFQSNHEGAIVDRIQAARLDGTDGIILNPAAYTHTSVAIRDSLLGVNIPFVECHISNVHAREPWRHHSYFSDKAQAVIVGLGVYGYVAALEWFHWKFQGGPMKGI